MENLPSFGRYEALFRIAAGGMAEVFAARIRGEAGFEKLVAVKRMLPHLAEDEQFVDMFLDEARVAVHVSSPYVVPTLDLGRADDGALYIVMELVVGQALSTLIRDQRRRGTRVPIPIAVELLAQAAQGLDDAHEAVTPTGVRLGLVHRDVSPHNVLVGVDGRARVTDFGIARAMMRRTSTQTGELKGKFAYFSPEQAEGRPVDRRADVFALGIVAWETMLGRRLFTGEDPMQLLGNVKTLPIPAVHVIDPEIPLPVSQAIARALERSLDKRWATAAELSHALREAGRTLGPTPTAREIGRWVGDAGGDSLGHMRSEIDRALSGDDVPTVARSGSSKKIVVVPPSAGSLEITLPPEPSTVGATTVASETLLLRPKRSLLVPIAVVALLGLGAGALFLGMRSGDPAPAAPSAEPTPLPSMSTPVAPSASTVTTVSASASVKAPKHWHKPGKVAPPSTAKTAEPPPPPPTAAPPPPATTTAPKQSGPLLPDEAFK